MSQWSINFYEFVNKIHTDFMEFIFPAILGLGRLLWVLVLAFFCWVAMRRVILPILVFIFHPFVRLVRVMHPLEHIEKMAEKKPMIFKTKEDEMGKQSLLAIFLRDLSEFTLRIKIPVLDFFANLVYVLVLFITEDYIAGDSAVMAQILSVVRMLLLVAFISRFLLECIEVADEVLNEDEEVDVFYPFVIINLLRIFTYFFTVLILIGTVSGRSPWSILAALSAFTIIIFVLFRNQIIAFAVSMQIQASKAIQVGDYFALKTVDSEGVVEDMTTMTLRVRNWDNTVSYILTNVLEASSFKNLSAFKEDGKRRSMISFFIDPTSVRYLKPTDKRKKQLWKYARLLQAAEHTPKEKPQQKLQKLSRKKSTIKSKTAANKSLAGETATNLASFRAMLLAQLDLRGDVNQSAIKMVSLTPSPVAIEAQIVFFNISCGIKEVRNTEAEVLELALVNLEKFDLRVGHAEGYFSPPPK